MWVKGKLSALALIRVKELEMEQPFCEGAAGWGPPFVGVRAFLFPGVFIAGVLGQVCEGGRARKQQPLIMPRLSST